MYRPMPTDRVRRAVLTVAMAGVAFGFAACSSTKDDVPYVERPAEQIYSEAAGALREENYTQAARLFDEVERQHPYSQWATKAQLMAAFADYQAQKYDEAIIALDRFIRLHPGNDEIDYAYYLKALCYYERISDVERDQRMTTQALEALQEVVRRFPDTDYARDARLKIDLTRDQLAGQEMMIGRFYLRREDYNAAINRFRNVVQNYQTTTHVPEALLRLTEAYLALGLKDEARTTAAVLGYNFPGSEWYRDSYALLVDANVRPEEPGFFGRTLGSLF